MIDIKRKTYLKPRNPLFGGKPRITRKEWDEALDRDWMGDHWANDYDHAPEHSMVFCYQGFTLYHEKSLVGQVKVTSGMYKGEYCDNFSDVIEIFLPYKLCRHKRCSSHQVFGPNLNPERARRNALNFLVSHNLIVLIEDLPKEQDE